MEVHMKFAILVGVALASTVVGCTQEPGTWSVESSSRTTAELNAVQSCEAQAESCAKMATSPSAIASCEQTFRSCLGTLIAEAGVPSIPPFDCGTPPVGSFDGGGFVPPFDGGGFVPPSFDGGAPMGPGVPNQPSFDGGFPGSACIDQLQTCLMGSTDPATCASQVVTCLKQAI
jgi:hypothetical protein